MSTRLHDEMTRYAKDVAVIWQHLGNEEMWEQVDAHLGSNYPEVSAEVRKEIVETACDEVES